MTPTFQAQARWDSPLGPITLAASAAGLAGLWFDDQRHHPGPLDAPHDRAHPIIVQATDELTHYFASPGLRFRVPLDLQGTPFQLRVWRALLAIAPGTTRTYADIARALGNVQACRAAGAAIGRNPVSIIVPCHRVVGRDGQLTGYAGGLHRKAGLLTLEQAGG